MGNIINSNFPSTTFVNFEDLVLPFIQVWKKTNNDLVLINHIYSGKKKLPEEIGDIIGNKYMDFFKNHPQIITDLNNCISKESNFIREIRYQNLSKKKENLVDVSFIYIPKNLVVATFVNKIPAKHEESVKPKLQDLYFSLLSGLDRIGIGIDIVNKDFQILFQNDFLLNRFGNLTEKLCYKEYMNLKEPCNFCPMIKSIKENKIFSQELIGGDGRNYKLVSIPFPNSDGNIEKAIELVIDITEQKYSKRRMKTLTTAIEQSTEGVAITDLNGKLIYLNPAFANIHGYSVQELKGKNLTIFHTDEQMDEVKKINRKIEREGHFSGEVWHLHKKGKVFPTLMQNSLIHDEYGQPIGMLGTLRDITNQKKRENILKESEEKYRLITEKSSDLIIIFNNKFQIEYINKIALSQILGYNGNEIIGRVGTDFIHPDDIDKVLKRFNKRFEILEGKIEARLKHKNGNYLWVECSGKLFKNIEGQQKILTISRDITKRKKMEYLIKEEIEKLKNLEEIRKEFITRISHELKTPLVSICGATELLIDFYKNKLDNDILDIIKIIESGGERLKKLVTNLLDVSKIEIHNLKIYKQSENFSEIIRETIKDLSYLADKRKITVVYDSDRDLHLDIDRDRIKQVLTNLLLNSIKNTLPGGKINIHLKKLKTDMIFKIKDTGVGFTKNERRRVFKKFGKIERHGLGMDIDTEGSGIGLYLSKEIIELHGGKIWLKSKGRNKGATFFVRLPL
jgi:PAS domain S-box-containing protein